MILTIALTFEYSFYYGKDDDTSVYYYLVGKA